MTVTTLLFCDCNHAAALVTVTSLHNFETVTALVPPVTVTTLLYFVTVTLLLHPCDCDSSTVTCDCDLVVGFCDWPHCYILWLWQLCCTLWLGPICINISSRLFLVPCTLQVHPTGIFRILWVVPPCRAVTCLGVRINYWAYACILLYWAVWLSQDCDQPRCCK